MKNNKKGNSYFLVTTALKESWKEKEQTVFLGEWCLIFNKDEYPNHVVNSYHWDDRKKYNRDYHVIDKLYEKKLIQFTNLLNEFHKTDRSIEYWRIIIGPWLRSIVEVIFDRYEVLKSLNYEVSDSIILDYDIEKFIPLNCVEFYSQIKSDEWNHMIFAEIIQLLNIPFHKSDIKLKEKLKIKPNLVKEIPTKVINYFLKIYSVLITKPLNKVLIKDPYMPLTNEFKLNLKFFQLPVRIPKTLVKKPKQIFERESIKILKSNSDFELLLNKLLINLIPYSYLENLKRIKKEINFYYPNNPKIIFTSNAYQHDDNFKIMTAERKTEKTKYIIGQHGGGFKTGLKNQTVLHQLKTCDKFFSWGWDNLEYNNIIKMPSLKLSRKINRPDIKGHILITVPSYPRYFYCHYSIPVAGQFLKTINMTIDFINSLNTSSSDLVKLKIDSGEFGWNLEERYISKGFKGMLTRNENLYKLLSQSRLSISTYNSTIFYETLANNFPTVIFFDSNFYEISEQAKEDFNILKSVGIYHDSCLMASKFVNSIINDVDNWWQKKEVQDARNAFCRKYAYKSSNYLNQWKDSLNCIKNDSL